MDTLVRFIQDAFDITNDQTTADLTAFLLSISGSDLLQGSITDVNRSPGVSSLDTPAAAGRQMLRQGGSAVDAAIAAQMVLALEEPQSSGIGGGAYLIVSDNGALSAYDGRETAPASQKKSNEQHA